jgi:hypothetical protein
VKIQLRNPLSLRCRRRSSSGRQHPGTTAIAKGGPGSPESLAQGMFLRGFPINPGELSISARKSGKTIAKGNRRRPRTDGRAVLRPRSTCEGGEPQGFRKERPRYPLEGRGEQGDVSVEGNIARCAGINRSEGGDERALRVRNNEPLGPEFGVVVVARQPTRHKTGDRWAGY